MTERLSALSLLVLLGTVVGLQAEEKSAAAIYAEQCAFCHGSSGAGNGPAAGMLSPQPTNFTAPGYWDAADAGELANTILKGKPGTPMVPFESSVSAQQASALVEYLRTLGR